MDHELAEIFQPQEVSPEILQFQRAVTALKTLPIPERRTRSEIEEDLWDYLGDFA